MRSNRISLAEISALVDVAVGCFIYICLFISIGRICVSVSFAALLRLDLRNFAIYPFLYKIPINYYDYGSSREDRSTGNNLQ